MSRFRKTLAPEALPGCCFICRGTGRAFFIDLGFQLEYPERSPFDGAAYLCSECLRELAQMAGYEVPDRVVMLNEEIEGLKAQNFNLLKRVDGLERAVDGLTAARDASRADSVWNTPVFSSSTDERTSSEGDSLGTGEGETSESVDDEGVGVVHSDEPAGAFRLNF